jgi:hypothetical protein
LICIGGLFASWYIIGEGWRKHREREERGEEKEEKSKNYEASNCAVFSQTLAVSSASHFQISSLKCCLNVRHETEK